ncbi:MAG TPA: hypothetical protein VFJ70_05640 [Burkholderiales bacterium]|nr:hypothetical protein [Burkholderiales bacterium]
MRYSVLIATLALALPALAQVTMPPNQPPSPSPSDLRGATGEDRPQGQAREDRTPSPSDLAAEGAQRVDGDRRTSDMPPSAAAGGSAAAQPAPLDNRGQPIAPR